MCVCMCVSYLVQSKTSCSSLTDRQGDFNSGITSIFRSQWHVLGDGTIQSPTGTMQTAVSRAQVTRWMNKETIIPSVR